MFSIHRNRDTRLSNEAGHSCHGHGTATGRVACQVARTQRPVSSAVAARQGLAAPSRAGFLNTPLRFLISWHVLDLQEIPQDVPDPRSNWLSAPRIRKGRS